MPAVAEDLVEVSSNEGDDPNAGISQLTPEKDLGGAASCSRNIDDNDDDRKRDNPEVSSPPHALLLPGMSILIKEIIRSFICLWQIPTQYLQ
jgi:hypothetical protein